MGKARSKPAGDVHCDLCKKAFRSNSKSSQCTRCMLYFHRSKNLPCFASHACQVPPDPPPPHLPVVNGQEPRSSLQNSSKQTQNLAPSTIGSTISLLTVTPTSTTPNNTSTTSSVLVSLASTTPPINSVAQDRQSGRSQQSRSRKPVLPPVSTEGAKIEYLKIGLNNSRTEIVKLDSEIADYKKKITVLNARIKIMSERENERLHGDPLPTTSAHLNPAPTVYVR